MTKKKIDDLTPEQDKLLDVYMDRWTRIGLSTAPAERQRAEDALTRAYTVAGLGAPKCRWVDSPMGLLIGATAADVLKAMGRTEQATLSDVGFGSHDAGWLSYYAFYREVLGLRTETEDLVPLMDLAHVCGWVLMLEGHAVLSERHSTLHLDPSSGLPHCLTGPAIGYPDGWNLYFVRGVPVKEEWVTGRATLDVRTALQHPNVEERAAAAELIGWDRVLKELKSRVVDVETSDAYDYGQLLEVDLPDEPGQKFLKVLCATGRTMVLRVPPTMTSARAANAWTNGFEDPSTFNPEIRT